MLLLSHGMNVISDEELLLLLEENTSRNLEFSYGLYQRFDFAGGKKFLGQLLEAVNFTGFRLIRRTLHPQAPF